MSLKDKEKWNKKYSSRQAENREACDWLLASARWLTGEGQALDLAMGEGRNALYLAQRGYRVTGVDISEVGVARAKALARENNLTLNTVVADLDNYEIKENEYDLISCFYFLDRTLFPAIKKGLKPGGLLIYQTFNVDYLKYSGFKKEWVLETNELLREFQDWHVLSYREVDLPEEENAHAALVARKWKNL